MADKSIYRVVFLDGTEIVVDAVKHYTDGGEIVFVHDEDEDEISTAKNSAVAAVLWLGRTVPPIGDEAGGRWNYERTRGGHKLTSPDGSVCYLGARASGDAARDFFENLCRMLNASARTLG